MPPWLLRLADRFKDNSKFVGEAIAVIGVVAIGVTFVIPSAQAEIVKYGLIAIFLISLGVFFLIRKAEHVAKPKQKSIYLVDIPCTPAQLDDAIEVAQYYFGSDALPPPVVRRTYRINPYSFIVIRDAFGKVVGYVDNFCIADEFFERFISGDLIESELTPEMFAGAEQIEKLGRLYIGGIAIRSKSKFEIGKLTKCLLYCGCEVLLKKYMKSVDSIVLYATGFTKEGQALLEDLGFGLVQEGKDRRDGAPLYWLHVTRTAVSKYRRNNPVERAELIISQRR